jgi:hypothetical protein
MSEGMCHKAAWYLGNKNVNCLVLPECDRLKMDTIHYYHFHEDMESVSSTT